MCSSHGRGLVYQNKINGIIYKFKKSWALFFNHYLITKETATHAQELLSVPDPP